MYSLIILAVLLGVGLLALRLWRGERLRRLALERIGLEGEDDFMSPAVTAAEPQVVRPYPSRYYWAPPAAGILVAVLVLWGTRLPRPYALGFGVLVTAITSLMEIRLADRRREIIESQLADAIDLMVASLQAGSALLAALEATLQEARMPMREELQSIIARIRVGEDPRSVVRQLARRVPTESFRLFCHALLVHWETGGYYFGLSCCSAAEVNGLHPRAAILSMGAQGHKEATPAAIEMLRSFPGLDLWQTEFITEGGEQGFNGKEEFIANMGSPGATVPYIKLEAHADGSFTVTNSRNGFSKKYPPAHK